MTQVIKMECSNKYLDLLESGQMVFLRSETLSQRVNSAHYLLVFTITGTGRRLR